MPARNTRKTLSRTEKDIIRSRLSAAAHALNNSVRIATEARKKKHDANLKKFNAKWLKKNWSRLMSAATLCVNSEFDWTADYTGKTNYRYELHSHCPVDFTNKDLMAKLADEYRLDAKAAGFFPDENESKAVYFPSLDFRIAVPSIYELDWQLMSDEFDMAVMNGDAQQLLVILAKFVK